MDTKALKDMMLSMNEVSRAGLDSGLAIGRQESAAEIKRLRAENERLRAALEACESLMTAAYDDRHKDVAFPELSAAELGRAWLAATDRARAALARAKEGA